MKKNKQMVKGLLPIVGILIISLSLSGCKNLVETNVGTETKGITQADGEAADNESVTEIKTIEPPEDGLSFDDVNIIEINGQQVSLPFKVEDLGEEYSIEKEIWNGGSEDILKYNNNYVACVDIDNNNIITSISILSEEMELFNVKICGLNCRNNFEEIIKDLGKPYKSSEFDSNDYVHYLIYKYSNGEIFITSLDYQKSFDFIRISFIN